MAKKAVDEKATQLIRPLDLDKVNVFRKDGKRVVKCFCGDEISRSIVPHLKRNHRDTWDTWVEHFVHLRSSGLPLKRIMRLYRAGNGPLLFSWTVIERAIREAVESGAVTYNPSRSRTRIREWEPPDFQPSRGTIWDFPRRGSWAVHSGDYRGNWPPQLVRNLILKYTDEDDIIVDAFVGGGTTLIEAWLCGRKSVGIDISRIALQTTLANLKEMESLGQADCRVDLLEERRPLVINGDALSILTLLKDSGIDSDSVNLVCVHPPYLDSLSFTGNDCRDLSTISDPNIFYKKLNSFAKQVHCVLKDRGVCALLMGDVRKSGRFIPLGINTAMMFQSQGFTLEAVVIKTQNRDRSAEFYRNLGGTSLLLEHEYLFIFRK